MQNPTARKLKVHKGRASLPTIIRRRGNSEKCLPPIGNADDDTEMSAPNLPPRCASFNETISRSSAVKLSEIKRSLGEIAEIYSAKFPVTVRVFAGLRRKTPLNEFLTIEQASCSDVITCSHNAQQFSIPLSVDLKFSVLWDEGGKDDVEILAGKEFTVDSLLRCHGNGPKVVSAMQDWERDGVSVDAGEVLVVKKAASKVDAPSELKVFSLTTRAEKTLPLANCPVLFTNRAQCISLHLPDIVAYVPELFPCRACILRHDFGPKCYPTYIVALERLTRARVLKFTSTQQAMNPSGAQPTAFIVPVDLPGVEVEVFRNDAIFSRDNMLPLDGGDDVACCPSPTDLESRTPEPPTVPPRCESPVYEKLPLRDEAITRRSTGGLHADAVTTTNDDCKAAMAGAGATHEGGTAPFDLASTETTRCPSPVYEKPCLKEPLSPSPNASHEEGYVAMTSDIIACDSGHVIQQGPTSSSEYEEMKVLTPNSCDTKAKTKTKKISVIYVNEVQRTV